MATAKKKTAPKTASRATPKLSVASKKSTSGKKLSSAETEKLSKVLSLRQNFGVSRKVFSRLSQFSERAIADWESGGQLGGASQQKMIELERLQQGLATVIEPSHISEWLQSPNESFDGLKPIEVIERGQVDRLWRMIYLLESGVPS